MAFDDRTAGVLDGHVFLPGGAPAGAGVEVAVEGPLPEVKVPTDENGRYEFPHILPEGYYKLTARDPVGGGLARLSVTLKARQPLTQNVQLKGRGTVRVQVVSGDDVPVESAQVKLTEKDFRGRTFDQVVRPGEQGRVAFLDVSDPLHMHVAYTFSNDTLAAGDAALGYLPRLSSGLAAAPLGELGMLTFDTSPLADPIWVDSRATFQDENVPTEEVSRLLDRCLAQMDRLRLEAPVIVSLALHTNGERLFLFERVCARGDQLIQIEIPYPLISQPSLF